MGREGQRHAAPYREREVRCQKAIDREPNESPSDAPQRERRDTKLRSTEREARCQVAPDFQSHELHPCEG